MYQAINAPLIATVRRFKAYGKKMFTCKCITEILLTFAYKGLPPIERYVSAICKRLWSVCMVKIETRRFKLFFFRLRCLVDTISHLYLSIFTPGYMLAVLFSLFSCILRTILICLTQKIVNYGNKQETTTTMTTTGKRAQKRMYKHKNV